MAATASALAELLKETGGEAKASVVGKLYARHGGAEHKAAIGACGGVRNFCRAHAKLLEYIEDGAGRVRLARGYSGGPETTPEAAEAAEAPAVSLPSPPLPALPMVLDAFQAALQSVSVRNLGTLKLDVEKAMGLPLDLVLRSMGRSLRSLAAEAVELRDVGTRCLALSRDAAQLVDSKKLSFAMDLVQSLAELVQMEPTITLQVLQQHWSCTLESLQSLIVLDLWGFSDLRTAITTLAAEQVGVVDLPEGSFAVRGGEEVASRVRSKDLASLWKWPEAAALVCLPAWRNQLSHGQVELLSPDGQLPWPLWEALLQDCTACPYAELAERAVLYLAQRSADVTGAPSVAHFHRLRVALALEEISSRAELRCFEGNESRSESPPTWHIQA